LATTMFRARRELPPSENEMIGSSSGMRRALNAVKMVAPTGSAVLIHGETGTGKELIARAVHNQSRRRHEPFVTLNCAAIPSGLLESELFGHERGAYTGALNAAIGRFQMAHQGTLFLDEIGDMPLELQPKLLRVLQEQEFERLGSTRTIQVDVRIVAATNRDLSVMVQERSFRADLFYRLNVFPIGLPPLRERSEDIPLLVRHFVEKFAERMNKKIDTIPDQVMEILKLHSWPGNIRELKGAIDSGVTLATGNQITVRDLPMTVRGGSSVSIAHKSADQDLVNIHDNETRLIMRALDESGGNRTEAAKKLGISRRTLHRRLKGLHFPES